MSAGTDNDNGTDNTVRTTECRNDDDVGVSRNFTGKVTVELWEKDDLDPDDSLGRHVIKKGSGTVRFTGDGSNYTLKYRVH